MRSLPLFVCLFSCAHEQPLTTVERFTYRGWEGSWRISNGVCQAVIVPAVARVMHFSRVGEPNLLWENPEFFAKLRKDGKPGVWMNFGGDKMWPTEQDQWPKLVGRAWPPDDAFDGDPCESRAIEGGVRITTPLSAKLGSRAVREFVLLPGRAAMHVRPWQEKVEGAPVPLSVWEVAQVRTPDVAILPLEKKELMPARWTKALPADAPVKWHASSVSIQNHPAKAQKIGVGGSEGWVAAVFGKTMLVVSHKVQAGARYPDDGCQAEIYTHPGLDGYVELELLSPLRELARGEALRDDVLWQIVGVSGDDAESAARLAVLTLRLY